ncbi:hypothetical protein ACFSJU_16920 [Paradesertivirga mongoliensis]|uniref:Uncharacterized protein n=1 Tax=Paradesertivirga mongoliensis TaxID=2100740 RepID=A0ABW4ZPP2_9SPHI|nr:hypothetical protein [Pedobacter mongoliensis]
MKALKIVCMKGYVLLVVSLVFVGSLSSQKTVAQTAVDTSLSRHPFVYAGEWDHRNPLQTIWIVKKGKVVWSYGIPIKDENGELQELGDVHQLSNGNILFSRKVGASEITPAKKIVWNYVAPKGTEIHTSQPIGKDKVLIMQNGFPAKLMIINKKSGKTEKELIIPTGGSKTAHGQFRHVRYTTAGTFLVAHMDMGKVVEYDGNGKSIWSVVAERPWAAIRLKNGNTLISGDNAAYAREVNAKGEVVWEFSQKDVPDILLGSVQECNRLANGNTVICNWIPNKIKDPKDWPTSVQILEVTPDKKVVWRVKSWSDPDLGPASAIQLLDEKGVAEKGELQR